MLLCDACDRGHHMYCLKPPVKTIPLGNWFCPSCRPKEVHVPRTPRKSFNEADIFDDEADSVAEDTANSISQENDSVANTELDEELDEEFVADSETGSEMEDAAAGDDNDSSYTPPGQAKVKLARASKKKSSAPPSRSSTPSVEANPRRSSQGAGAVLSGKRAPKPKIPFDVSANLLADGASLTSRSRSRRTVDVNGGLVSQNVLRRKPVIGWDDYEVDSKRMSLTTKSRYSDVENHMKTAEELVKELMHQEDAWPFLKPVTKKEALDYFDIVKNPMDFARIRNKINRFEYDAAREIIADIRLIFSNCALYNQPATIVAMAGDSLCKFFENRLCELNLDDSRAVSSATSRGTKNCRKRTM